MMGDIIRTMDWGKSSLRKIEFWPTSLRTTLGLLLHSNLPMFLFWSKELYCFYNDAFRASLGSNWKNPAIGKKGKEVWQDDWENIEAAIIKIFGNGQPITFHDQKLPYYRNRELEETFWTYSCSAAFDDNGAVNGALVTCTKTKDKVKTVKDLQFTPPSFWNIMEQVPIAISVHRGRNYITEMINPMALEVWSKNKEDIIGRPLLDGIQELRSHGIKEALDEVYETGKSHSASEIAIQIDRKGQLETKYLNLNYRPYLNHSGEIDGILVTGIDVTDQVSDRQKIEENEKKFQLLANTLPQHTWTADPIGNLNYLNSFVYEFTGLSRKQVKDQHWSESVHPDDREKTIKAWSKAITTGKDFLLEHRLLRHDGIYRWQLSQAKPQMNEYGEIQMWVGSSIDIEDKKTFIQVLERRVKERTSKLVMLNENLKKSEQRYHLMVEEVQDYAIIYLNRKGIVKNWNAGAEKIKGYKAHEIIGKNFSNFYSEKDIENGLPEKLLRQATKQNRAIQEGWRVRKDKSLFWASVVITAIHNKKNKVIGFTKVTHDLTEKKEFEDALKNKNVELEQKNTELEKMNKELESFAFISSHDLQEPLRKIQTFASRIVEKDKDALSEKGKYLFQRMQLSAERMQALINDLLSYSRTYNLEADFKKTDLNVLFEKVKQELSEELIQKNAIIEKNAPFVIRIIPFQFEQIFFNLLSNSIKFSRPEVPLRIKIAYEFVTDTNLKDIGLKENTTYGHIVYSDNGIGFDQNYNVKIFELFQRLHGQDEYPGTGLGLAIIKRIIEHHKGAIMAKGELGEGSTFDIYIPTEKT